jgi:hypothetical protein
MSELIDNKQCHLNKEGCHKSGISKANYHCWIKQGIISDDIIKDCRGWRLFPKAAIKNIGMEADKRSTRT